MSSVIPPEPTLVVASEVFGHPFGLSSRREVWARCNRNQSIALVSKILAHLDYSMITNDWQVIEQAWGKGLPGDPGIKIRARLARGHTALSPFAMVQSIKEVILYADDTGGTDLSAIDFARCVLGINEQVDSDALGNPETWADIHDNFTMFAVAETSALHFATIATLAADANDIWFSNWPATTDPGITSDIGSGPADMFLEATGISIEDFFSLGFLLYRKFEQSKDSRLPSTLFVDHSIPDEVKEFFIGHCTLSVTELKKILEREASGGEAINPWSRYTLQQRPFLLCDDGSIIILRLQYALQRFFGDHPYLESQWLLGRATEKKVQAEHYAGAMRHLFECRVGDVLARISKLDSPRRDGIVVSDPDFRSAWGASKSGKDDEICDWGYFHGDEMLLFDANMRSLLQGLAENTAEIGVLDKDIREKYKKKFSQLVSTIRQFREKSWPDSRVKIDNNITKFVPLVLAPDDGMAINFMTQLKILEVAVPMIVDLGGSSLPPGIIRWRELLMLEGAVESYKVDFMGLLIEWRIEGSDGTKLATSLQEFLERQPGFVGFFPKRHRKGAEQFFDRVSQHGFGWTLRGLSPTDRRREINKYQAITGKTWRE